MNAERNSESDLFSLLKSEYSIVFNDLSELYRPNNKKTLFECWVDVLRKKQFETTDSLKMSALSECLS